MKTRTVVETNARLNEALAIVNELVEWADEDSEHARANGAPETASDDFRRGTALRRARIALRACLR